MMFSSIDEAWATAKLPNNSSRQIIESFDVNSACNCEQIIAQLVKCPDCVKTVRSLFGIENQQGETLISQINKHLALTPELKERLTTVLILLAIIVIVKLIISK